VQLNGDRNAGKDAISVGDKNGNSSIDGYNNTLTHRYMYSYYC
jgi:hypothetical protein